MINPFYKQPLLTAASLLIAILLYCGGLVHGRYLAIGWPFSLTGNGDVDHAKANGDDEHAGHDHATDPHDHSGHAHGHSGENSVELSEKARQNLGLTDEYLQPIQLTSFDRSLSVPAIVVDRPGRTRLPLSAATTGIVTHVHAVTGQAVQPGDLIFEIRLTHEDLVTAQKEYLQALGDRDIELKEIARLEKVASSGAVSSKTLLERQYSRDKVESLLKSQREALRLHGLSETQIDTIGADRRLLTELKVLAPDPDSHSKDELQFSQQSPQGLSHGSTATAVQKFFVLQDLHVEKGQTVNAGELLCTLADFSELLIEGQAFEQESSAIAKAKVNDWKISAIVEENGQAIRLDDLTLIWIDNEIDSKSRALKFYVSLPNELLQNSQNANGDRYITWRYRVGQRMQLRVPIERWNEQIVLPVDAVVREGLESYLFQQNGDHYDRVSVHERFRDQTQVVIENDGTVYPGDIVAMKWAHQLQMALKNRAGGAVDPHAGHSH